MASEAGSKMQNAMTALVEDLHKSFLRTMQKKMHLCAANCCEDSSSPVEKVQRCVEKCQFPVTQAETFVQKELSEFQERLQRCVLVCQDKIRDRVNTDTNEAQEPKQRGSIAALASGAGNMFRETTLGIGGVEVYKAEFETCALQCVDDHLALMPSIKRRISSALNNS